MNDCDVPDRPATAFLGNISQVMSPVLVGMQAGFMTGHLARRALGQYDLPIPRPAADELLVVAATVDRFASDRAARAPIRAPSRTARAANR